MRWISLLCICFSLQTFAGESDWYIGRDIYGSALLIYRYDMNMRISLTADPAHTTLVDVKPHQTFKHIEVIRYLSSAESSHQLMVTERAVLFNTQTHRILGDFPIRITSKRSKPDQQPRQPKWFHDARSLKIFDPETRQTTVLPM